MTTTSANANDQTKKAPPIFWAPKHRDKATVIHGVTLWVNDEKPKELEPAVGDQPAKMTKPPQMIGYLYDEGVQIRIAAWVHEGQRGAFVTVKERNKKNDDGSYSNKELGKGNAVNTEGVTESGEKKQLAANRTPYMLFNFGEKTFRAMAAPGAVNYMEACGFTKEVTDNYEAKVAADAQAAAASAAAPGAAAPGAEPAAEAAADAEAASRGTPRP